jgi:hypothetical protein
LSADPSKPIRRYEALDVLFRDIDYADIKTIQGAIGLRPFIAGMLSYHPWWIVTLYRIREILLVQALGLTRHEKPDQLPSIQPEALSFTPGQTASFFTVRTAMEDTYWVSETPADRHLKAWVGVVVESLGGTGVNRFHVFTLVKYRHWTGPVYFNLIRPFHHLVVRQMMRAGLTR